jgi:hypothetical protein
MDHATHNGDVHGSGVDGVTIGQPVCFVKII